MNPNIEARWGYSAVDSPFSTDFIENPRNFDTSAPGPVVVFHAPTQRRELVVRKISSGILFTDKRLEQVFFLRTKEEGI